MNLATFKITCEQMRTIAAGAFSCLDVTTNERDAPGVAAGLVNEDEFMDAVLAIDQGPIESVSAGPAASTSAPA